ncbi:Gfo/Idh/MocA family oxidoreductase [Streptomyces sp. P01-B04]|uniref:Gfo/Idh/MocA family protein n=1 Tax=Streptomyces poriferorum TaxID=2798799 RepID=UPI001C5F4348|nr:Gfo/Idh/MocA family oxidoreductase [Streptomyces poriferorum]MBW5248090.1 Gfo/Idh/MocA family oxidoreductase [Streptomyces poriferorum]MBW5255152.1 Gfo/Idh/MocA family oxidoreductase [Streptomyces poriferorum]
MMRAAVIGAGFGEQHLAWLRNCPEAECGLLVYGQNREKAEKIATEYGVPRVSDDVRDAFDDAYDLTVIAAPVDLHAEIAEEALGRGKWVVCEKPLTLTVESAESVVRAAEAAGVPHMTMFQWRFHPAFGNLRDMITDGRLGRVVHMDLQFHHDFLAGPSTAFSWRHTKSRAAAGAFADQGVHLFDLLNWTTGQEYAILGAASSIVWPIRTTREGSPVPGRTEDVGSVLAQSPGGTIATISVLRVTGGHRRLRVTASGTDAVVSVEVCPDTSEGRLDSSVAGESATWPAGSLENPYPAFLASNTGGTDARIPDFSAGLAAQRLLESAAAHSPAVLSE